MNATLLREYSRLRRPHVSAYGVRQESARVALEEARALDWFNREWNTDREGRAVSHDGRYRISILPDEDMTVEDVMGDTFDPDAHGDTVPGGRRTIEAERKAYVERVERDGIWGYVLEERLPSCDKCGRAGDWEHVDSCWGFDDAEYCRNEAIRSAYSHAKGGQS